MTRVKPGTALLRSRLQNGPERWKLIGRQHFLGHQQVRAHLERVGVVHEHLPGRLLGGLDDAAHGQVDFTGGLLEYSLRDPRRCSSDSQAGPVRSKASCPTSRLIP